MARILIAGCGYVGTATAELFHATGWQVEGWVSSLRSAKQRTTTPYPVRAVDISDEAAVAQNAAPFDAIVHCASSGGGNAEDYRRIFLNGVRNLTAVFPGVLALFTSSTSVYAQQNGEWVTELSPAKPERESGRILREAEKLMLARGGIVARLAGIYGPGRSALLRKFLDGTAVLNPDSDRFVNQVHRDDIAAALFLLIQHYSEAKKAAGRDPCRVFNVSDNHPCAQRECYEWLVSHLRRPLPPVGRAAGERKRGNSNKRVSSDKLHALGWSPDYPTFQVAMRESVLPSFGL